MTKLKQIDFSQTSFTANGKEYFIETELSIQRAVYYDVAKLELETSVGIGKQVEDWAKVYDLANQQKFADIVVLAYNNRRGYKNMFETIQPALKVAACFLNETNEDRRFISDDLVEKKVADWREEGITQKSFFDFAVALIKIETKGYEKATADISEIEKELQEKATALNTTI